MKQSKKITY